MSPQAIMWAIFAVVIAVMVALDIWLYRTSHEITFKEAARWTAVWVSLALAFNACVWWFLGHAKALEFLTGYIIEESLSVDNLFVFIMIFTYFGIKKKFQPKILKWGIFGALIMRAIFIVMGIGLMERFHWMVYLFGGILVFTGIKMCFGDEGEIEPEKNLLVRLVREIVPVTKRVKSDKFFIRRRNLVAATPLFLTLVVVESSDVIFAIDSIPAVLAVTRDPFIVYTSNVFAIMGLRSLYYLLAHVVDMFRYLKVGVSFILAFVGAKMLLSDLVPIPLPLSLGVIVGTLVVAILFSVAVAKREGHQ